MRAWFVAGTVLLPASLVAGQNLHYGVNAHDVSTEVASQTSQLGAGVVRVVFGWDIIEPNCKGCFNWSITDAWVREAQRSRTAVFATLGYAPRWANGDHTYNYPPLDDRDWYDFVFAVASRYKTEIVLWGVWNEPNLDAYLRGGDLATYERLARVARSAIAAANPAASVLGPEVSHHAMTSGWFADAMARFGEVFDIVTVHWYPDGPDLETMMDRGVRPLSRFKSVWLTEVGMEPCASGFGEAGQALLYQRVLNAFSPRRAWWTTVIFYDLYDPPGEGRCGSGMLRSDWSRRASYLLYQAFIRANP